MKKIIKLLFLGLLVIALLACSEEAKDKPSAPTGYDFTSPDWSEGVDYYVLVRNISDVNNFPIGFYSKHEVFSSELIINNAPVETEGNWEAVEDWIFGWQCHLVLSDLPNSVYYDCGNTFKISLTINGEQFEARTCLPDLITLDYTDFNTNKDFLASWHEDKDPMSQIVTFFFGQMDNIAYEKNVNISPSRRSWRFDKEDYSDYSMSDIEVYGMVVEALNYVHTDEFLLLTDHSCGGSAYLDSKSELERAKYLLKQVISPEDK